MNDQMNEIEYAIQTSILYELQEGMGEDILAAKLAGFLRQSLPGMGDDNIAMNLRHFFRNSDNKGRRFQVPHPSCY